MVIDEWGIASTTSIDLLPQPDLTTCELLASGLLVPTPSFQRFDSLINLSEGPTFELRWIQERPQVKSVVVWAVALGVVCRCGHSLFVTIDREIVMEPLDLVCNLPWSHLALSLAGPFCKEAYEHAVGTKLILFA